MADKRVIIIWTDFPDQVLALRAELRSKGDVAVIRDAKFVDGSFVEPAKVLMFSSATRKDEIIAAYKAPAYRDRFGEPEFIDVAVGEFGEPVETPALPAAPAEPEQPDALEAQVAAMEGDELKANYKAIVGKAAHHMKSDEVLRKELLEELRKA